MNFNIQDLSGTFSTFDIVVSLTLSFVLSAIIGWVYRLTHKNVSYSQSYVQTLVTVGMVISLIMLVVGSNVARAFALVGALSVVRFRNAIKETRDVGFIFLVMAIGMATGTRFYVLAIAATFAICLVMVVMSKFDWFKLDVQRQVVKVQVPPDADYTDLVEDVLIKYCKEFELVSTESVRSGALTELYFTAQLRSGKKPGELIAALSEVNTGQRVSVLTGYDQTDI
ncbi:DUF4956 domain-containing protein [Rhodococcus sp. 15-725-2-2b]|jgi:uncharacterized membrane protein YhiD involved in acid resistance|uniref:DUF4956 domain-containing protein n=1 Tax=Nocardiaceae TaxID=85025 RepID=UPI00050C18C0|nr:MULTISPECIES: DUF4956 domain-containing protein [Rhodococcus]OZC59845.1 DUF4956 domain-containing protein [Rhodococcus sp. 06-470-2]OZC68717.1 DUF4956 domain-containing protein [Rhodococcus sp. 06-469-3-2]OZC73442.1 DUF4956 domain-containing protein [Rhodococcus sp. 06-418-5]OZD45395.1 DUF4956 domain-containing protein [Rhodococcus sp. 06-1477-1A]OZD83662.1 DUF4956 domain-containing protein [Rhodococcus sp. 05-339-2]